MLAHLLRATACASLLCVLSAPASADRLPHDLQKVLAAKAVDRDGYVPGLGKGDPALESEPNDDIASANELLVFQAMVAELGVGDIDVFAVACDGESYLTVSTASREGSLTDTVVRVLSGDGSTLLAEDDDNGDGLFSSARHVPCGGESVVYVVVEHFSATGSGGYLLVAEPGMAPPPLPANDTVAGAIKVDCNSAAAGTTLGATSTVSGVVSCVRYDPAGGDVFFRVEVPYSNQLNVAVSPSGGLDPSVYLFTDPADPSGSCIAGNDEGFAGDVELAAFIHEEDTGPLTVYIAVDSWSAANAGDFALAVTCEFVVATQPLSFGRVKARF